MVFDKLDRIGHIYRDEDGNLNKDIEVDSIMDSAFDSSCNRRWLQETHQPLLRAPQNSEFSIDDVVLCKSGAPTEESERDPFSEASEDSFRSEILSVSDDNKQNNDPNNDG